MIHLSYSSFNSACLFLFSVNADSSSVYDCDVPLFAPSNNFTQITSAAIPAITRPIGQVNTANATSIHQHAATAIAPNASNHAISGHIASPTAAISTSNHVIAAATINIFLVNSLCHSTHVSIHFTIG